MLQNFMTDPGVRKKVQTPLTVAKQVEGVYKLERGHDAPSIRRDFKIGRRTVTKINAAAETTQGLVKWKQS